MEFKEYIEKIRSELSKLKDMEDEKVKEVYSNVESYLTEISTEKLEKETEQETEENKEEGSSEENTEENQENTEENSEENTEENTEEENENKESELSADVKDNENGIELAKWSTKYINDLPDSAFVIIEPAYKEGKIDDKNARHLPYKTKEGEVDLPHLRNALARVNQIKPVTDSIDIEELREKAQKRLETLKKEYLSDEKEMQLSKEVSKKLEEASIELNRKDEEIATKEELINTYKTQVTELTAELEKYKEAERIELQKEKEKKVDNLIELYSNIGIKKSKENIKDSFTTDQIDNLITDLKSAVPKKETKVLRQTEVNANLELSKTKKQPLNDDKRATLLFGL